MDFLLVAGGLVALVVGGGWLVSGGVALAARLGLSPAVIGATVLGFGTSLPELVTSLTAAFAGAPGLSVGNVVGSNIGNILLILGLVAVVAPVAMPRTALRRDGIVLAIGTLLGTGALLTGALGPVEGIVLLAGLAAYVWFTVRSGAAADDVDLASAQAPLSRTLLGIGGGLAATILGAGLLVEGATGLALGLGVSEAVIGLTVVAIGTSLPELVTSLVAARRGQSGVAIGNIFGSNVFNLLAILGITAMIAPIPVPAEIIARDIWIMLAATVLLIATGAIWGRIGRVAGLVYLGSFAAYIALLATSMA